MLIEVETWIKESPLLIMLFLLNNGIISWSSKKQTYKTLSTIGAEFIACSATVKEVIWLKKFIEHLEIIGRTMDAMQIFCDSQETLTYIKDLKYHSKTKYIDTKYNFIKDIIARKEITL